MLGYATRKGTAVTEDTISETSSRLLDNLFALAAAAAGDAAHPDRRPKREAPPFQTQKELAWAADVTDKRLTDWKSRGLVLAGAEAPFTQEHLDEVRFVKGLLTKSEDERFRYKLGLELVQRMLAARRNRHGLGLRGSALRQLPDLLWSFYAGAWVTRRTVLLGYLSPQVPLVPSIDVAAEERQALDESVTPEDSFLRYRETDLASAEAIATLAVFRFLRQAYHAHRDNRLAFEQAVDRIRARVPQLAALAVHDEGRPSEEALAPGFDCSTFSARQAADLHDAWVRGLADDEVAYEFPDLLQPTLSQVTPEALREAAHLVRRAEGCLHEWARGLPGTDVPEGPPLFRSQSWEAFGSDHHDGTTWPTDEEVGPSSGDLAEDLDGRQGNAAHD